MMGVTYIYYRSSAFSGASPKIVGTYKNLEYKGQKKKLPLRDYNVRLIQFSLLMEK